MMAASPLVPDSSKDSDPEIIDSSEDPERYTNDTKLIEFTAYTVIFALIFILLTGIVYIVLDLHPALSSITNPSWTRILTYTLICGGKACGSYYGLFFIHRYGSSEQQLIILEDSNKVLMQLNKRLDIETVELTDQVDQITDITDNHIRPTQDKLSKVVQDGDEIGRIAESVENNNDATLQFFNHIRKIQESTKELQREIDKNELIKIFYELQFSEDNEDGLNREEYNSFLYRLDKMTADIFREVTSFDKMHKNRNKNINIHQFERALNKVFDILDEKDQENVDRKNETNLNHQF